jgi:hypothetical protein
MFTPLFFRRLLFLLSSFCFGVATQYSGFTCFKMALVSFVLGVAEQAMGTAYGAAAQPLIPALPKLPTLPKGARALLLGVSALAVFLFLPRVVRVFYPDFNAFGPDTINAYTLGACQFFTALTMAYAAWRLLFPSLYAYAAETMEGKILESITSELVALLPGVGQWDAPEALASLAERRKIATLTFTVRCTRFAFSVLPFFLFLLLANHALASALTAVPASGPGL